MSLINYRNKYAKNILWAFVIFFGFTFAISKESAGSDINSYIEQYASLYGKPMTIQNALHYYESSKELDLFRPLLAILLSRISNSPIVLTTVYAFIFGFFYSRNIFYLMHNLDGKLTKWTWLLIVVFTLIVPFWSINGFRFWTATHIFLYGILPFLYEKKKTHLLYILLALLFHFSFIIPLVIVALFLIIPKRLDLMILIFLLSIVYNEINIQWISTYIESTEEVKIIDRTDPYVDEERVDKFRKGELKINPAIWYVKWRGKGLSYFVMFMIFFIYWIQKSKKILTQPLLMVLCFGIWFYSSANLLSTIPSGGRYLTIAHLLSLFVIIIVYQNYYRKYFEKLILPISFPLLLLFVIVSLRIGFYNISITTIFGNPISALISYDQVVALNELIK